ncbi:hypothetical protein GIB67_025538 [Kingdonia uniflora]|uniref:Aminotransferase-like plant mobile domain-containing protein n=1 Tax=Kingdonia uniflora TaxID=39325 RepID=A0A7J7M0C2_9MAGN|nr:hypothetical protein GIB67_025538 [Kingdonia uniflora]
MAREEDLLIYKRKKKTIDPSTVVPPNTVDTTNKGVSEPVPQTESAQAALGAQDESAQAVNISQGSEFETETAQATLGEGATRSKDVGPSDKSMLRSFRLHRARSIVLRQVFENNLLQDLNTFNSLKAEGAGNSLSLRKLKEHYAYKLEKVLSDDIAVATKKKGLTARSIARAYMLYVLGSFLFPRKKGIDVSTRYLYLFAKDKVVKKWSWGSTVLAYMYYNLGAVSRDD